MDRARGGKESRNNWGKEKRCKVLETGLQRRQKETRGGWPYVKMIESIPSAVKSPFDCCSRHIHKMEKPQFHLMG